MDAAINTTHQVAVRKLQSMPEFRFESMHAVDSLIERTRLTSDDLLEVLYSGRGVWMNNPAKHWQRRAYILFYSVPDAAFFIIIIACDPGKQAGSIVTVLTQQQYENDRGEVYRHILLRALTASTAPSVVIRDFKLQRPGGPTRRQQRTEAKWQEKLSARAKRLTIIVDYLTPTGVFERKEIDNPPGYDSTDVIANTSSILQQDGFWEWFSAKVAEKQIPVERVLAIKASRAGCEPISLMVG